MCGTMCAGRWVLACTNRRRAPRGREALVKPLYHWRIQLPPDIHGKAPATRIVSKSPAGVPWRNRCQRSTHKWRA
eukprot:9468060-Pyramimonas_sp.AAC.1